MSCKSACIVLLLLFTTDLTLVKTKPTTRKGVHKDHKTVKGQRPNRQEKLFPQDCGNSSVPVQISNAVTNFLKSGRTKRVVGGKDSQQGQWPWQVALLYNGGQYCGGSLVNKDWVVTAAHCFNPFSSTDPKNWSVIIGEHHLTKREPFEQKRKVKNIVIHPRYKSMWFEGIYDTPPKFDVAVIELEKSIKYAAHIQPICLYRPDLNFRTGEECFVVGWGHTSWGGKKPERLNHAKVRLVSRNMCNHHKAYNGTIHGTAICAGFRKGGVDSCEYDSGGGLVCNRCGRYYLLGLVSWGHECARPWKFGVYANMVVLTSWVQETIRKLVAEKRAKEKSERPTATTDGAKSTFTTPQQATTRLTSTSRKILPIMNGH